MKPKQPLALSTELIHHAYVPPVGFASPVVPTYKGSTVFFPNVAAQRARTWLDRSAYTYGLHGTPTLFTLEERLCTLEGATHAMLAPSGLAAVTLVSQALLSMGDHVLLPHNVYAPNLAFTRNELQRWGISHSIYNAMQPESLRAALKPSTRVVWVEAAGSLTLEFPDLRALIRTVREHAPQARIVLDNTWGAGIAFAPFDLGEGLGVDVSVHALTKYPSGGGDVLMGSVTCRDDALYETLAMTHSRLGIGVGANDAELVLRSLPSIAMRYAHHDASTREVARWLQTHPRVKVVFHPALETSPGHAAWKSLCKGAAGLVSFRLAPTDPSAASIAREHVDRVVDGMRLFRIGYSWGGPTSLVVPYDMDAMRASGEPPQGMLVRLSIGLEDPRDLIADLERAFDTSR